MENPLNIVQQLRNRREMVDWGNGNVTDEPDGLCEEAANEIEELWGALAIGREAVAESYDAAETVDEKNLARARLLQIDNALGVALSPQQGNPAA